jgi:hypothetical protein
MGGVDFVEALGFGDHVAVVDYCCGEVGDLESGLQGGASALAPADGADAVFPDVGLFAQKADGVAEVASGAVFGKAAHEFMHLSEFAGDFAAIEIDGERDVVLVG